MSQSSISLFLEKALACTNALTELHQKEIIYNDINLNNIIFDPITGKAAFSQSSLSFRLRAGNPEFKTTDTVHGSLPYLSPEQTGRLNVVPDVRSDLYGLGVVFYEMLTGKPLFLAKDTLEWIHSHLALLPVPPHEVSVEIPHVISDVVMKLLQKRPEERYQSAAGLKYDLNECKRLLSTFSQPPRFRLGLGDFLAHFDLPRKIYGRNDEKSKVLQLFERVRRTGSNEILLVSGYSGVGKSALISELKEPARTAGGSFVSGKFDQYNRDAPYATLVQACQTLIREVLTQTETRLVWVRENLLKALGSNGSLMTRLVPEVETMIGEQPPVPELGPAETQNRFHQTLLSFLKVFSNAEHPLVLFLDDMQWADSGTLGYLTPLLKSPEIQYLTLVLAFRDREVDSSHPFSIALDKLKSEKVAFQEIILQPLNLEDSNQFIADTLRADPSDCRELAKLIHTKTQGNPFFLGTFLKALYQEKLLSFDTISGKWTWNQSIIEAKSYTDNVAEFMKERFQQLDKELQETLKISSCIGNSFNQNDLASVCRLNLTQLTGHLERAESAGFLLKERDSYKFVHDRIHQTAYMAIPEENRQHIHLEIARTLSQGQTLDSVKERLFDVVSQFNFALNIIESPTEKDYVRGLNYLAGKRAKESTAYLTAQKFFSSATQLLTEDPWNLKYDETLALYLAFSEAEYLCGNHDAASKLFLFILSKANSDLDKARIHFLQTKLYQVAGKYHEAVQVGLIGLKHLGVIIPDSDEEIQKMTGEEKKKIDTFLQGRTVASLLDVPPLNDPHKKAIIDLLSSMAPCTYIGRPILFPLMTLLTVSHSLSSGNAPESCFGYSCYGVLLVALYGDIPMAFEFSELSIKLNEKFKDVTVKGSILHVHGDHINFWKRHISTGIPILESSFLACIEAGDLVYGNYVGFQSLWHHIETGKVLDEIHPIANRNALFARKTKHDAVLETILIEQQFVRAFQGLTNESTSLNQKGFDENVSLDKIRAAQFGCGLVFYHTVKMILHYHFGAIKDALASAQEAKNHLASAMSMPMEFSFEFYYALLCGKACLESPEISQEEKLKLQVSLQNGRSKFANWSHHCPENFSHKLALIDAEISRLKGQDTETLDFYEKAIELAEKHGFIQYEGLASELAGNFCTKKEWRTSSRSFYERAQNSYRSWGSNGKVNQISKLLNLTGAQTNKTVSGEQLDLLSILKSSQSIAAEMDATQLYDKLISIVVQHAGADRGVLMLPDDNNWKSGARITYTLDHFIEMESPGDSKIEVPLSIVHYVARTKKSINGSLDELKDIFKQDVYFKDHNPLSILCLPVTSRGELCGVLYLENKGLLGAFTAGRLEALDILCSQVGTSIQNSNLFMRLQASQKQMGLVTDSVPVLVAYLDANCQYRFINHTGEQWHRKSRSEIFGRSLYEILGEKNYEGVKTHVMKALSGERVTFDSVIHYPDGIIRNISATYVPDRDPSGKVRGIVVLGTDMSERKRAEEERTELVAREKAAIAASQLKSDFLANMSHEIRTPIHGIIGMLGLVRETKLLPDQLDYIDTAKLSADALLKVINDILDFSKVEAGKLEFDEIDFDLIGLLKDVEKAFSYQAAHKGVQFSLEIDKNTPKIVSGDPGRLKQVLTNLLSNALKFTLHGQVSIRVRPEKSLDDESRIYVEVSDTGIGIPQEAIPRMFQSFSQADASTTRRFGGTGLGLSICKHLVARMNGDIGVKSTGDKGTTFWFTASFRHSVVSALQEKASDVNVQTSDYSGIRVLIADDNVINQKIVSKVLQKLGILADTALNGYEVLQAHEKDPYDLILMDCQMPDLDGYEATRQIRASKTVLRTDIPIIAMTANAIRGDRERCMSAGMDDYFSKPIRIGELQTKLNHWLELIYKSKQG